MTQRMGVRAWLGVVVLALVGCESESDVERTVDASSRSIRAAVHSNLSVSSKLASALRDQPGNLFYSPLSIEAVTGLLFAGAAGDTAAQLGKLLDTEGDPEALHEGLGALLLHLSRQHSQYTLSVANRLWATPELKLSQAFVDTSRDNYRAPIEWVAFKDDPEAARAEINHWVSEQTANKIPELFESGQISASTVMAVVNAIYFKADWATAFDPKLTRSEPFHRAGSSDVTVDMMTTPKTKLRAAFEGNAFWLELPYRAGEVSFLAYTRGSAFGSDSSTASVQELQDDLAEVDLNRVVESLHEEELVAQLPKFSMRSRLNLIPVFEPLGVTDLFDPGSADLSKLSTSTTGFVSPFVHEAAVWVDELGTVAVAATAAGVLRSGPREVRFDHPFLFFIRDNRTGAIVFSGRVADPSAGAAD